MRKQDQLSALINSLSNNEKRYFKLQASLQKGDKTFTRLFDEMAKSSVYEPEMLSKKLNITKSRLMHVKNYMEQVLLDSLQLYAQNKDLETSLTHQYLSARLLYKRNQHALALSVAEKALHKALKYENFAVAINLTKVKYSLAITKVKLEEAAKAEKQRNFIVAQFNEVEQIFNMTVRFNKIIMTNNKNKYLQKPVQNLLFKKDPGKLKSDTARIRWHEMKKNYYFYGKEDTKMSIHHALCALRIFEARPSLIRTAYSSYVNAMIHLSIAYNVLGNYEEALKAALKIEFETDGHRKDMPLSICSEANMVARVQQCIYLCHLGKYEDAAKKFSKIENESGRLNPVDIVVFKFYYALTFFYTLKPDKALKISEDIYTSFPGFNPGLILQNRILLIMIHHALKNYSLLPHYTASAVTWAQRHKIDWPGTSELIRWFQKFEKMVASNKEEEFFEKFQQVIRKKILKGHVIELDLKRWVAMNLNKPKPESRRSKTSRARIPAPQS